MELYLLNILFYVPTILALLLLIILTVRSFGSNLNLCLINLTVTSLAETIRITALVIPRAVQYPVSEMSLGQGIVEHLIRALWLYSILLYFVLQTHHMRKLDRRKIPQWREIVAILCVWLFAISLSLAAVLTAYFKSQNYDSSERAYYNSRFASFPKSYYVGVYFDDISYVGINYMRYAQSTFLIEMFGYVGLPLLALGITAAIAYRRWCTMKRKINSTAAVPSKSTRGIEEEQATPGGYEVVHLDGNATYTHKTKNTASYSTSNYEWAIRKVSINWFCPAVFVILSIFNLFLWLFMEVYRESFLPHLCGSVRLFSYLGAISLVVTHDRYLNAA